jgi:hypothetical protein
VRYRTRQTLVDNVNKLLKTERPRQGSGGGMRNFMRLAVLMNVATALACWWLGWDAAAQVHAGCAAVLSLLSA